MIRGIYAPTDLTGYDRDPSVTPEEKLEVIARSPVTVRPYVIEGKALDWEFVVSLPFTRGGIFSHSLESFPNVLLTTRIFVGDPELYGKGIGSRLLKAAFRHGVEINPRVNEFRTGWARLGLVNATAAVLGAEQVQVETDRPYIKCGWGTDRPLDAMFDVCPTVEGEPYLVRNIVAAIDRDLAMSWEPPVLAPPELS